MTLVYSTMLKLGTKLPNFSLPDTVDGSIVSLGDFKGKKAVLVIFLCRHCPYVQHIKNELTNIGNKYLEKGLGIVAISANDAENYPEDSPESLAEFAREENFTFPVCYDETQNVAKAYTASCTPDIFLADSEFNLVYRGQLDSSRPGNNEPVTGSDLRDAIDAVIAGQSPPTDQKPASGCNIKWKPGSAPDYFNH
ncbi:thioredoxin family protein [Patescibacteria group bacterium]